MATSTRDTLIEARLNRIEAGLETVVENQLRFDKKLDRLSEEIAETNRAIRQTNAAGEQTNEAIRQTIAAVEQTNTAVRMFVTAILAKEE